MMEETRLVCIVEYDAILGKALREHLTCAGFQVDWYRNAKDALNKLCAVRYDILICDVGLPDMQGETLFRKLIKLNGCVPTTYFLTPQSSIKDAIELLKLGAHDYLVKPLDLHKLVSKLSLDSRLTYYNKNDNDYCFATSSIMHELEQAIHSLADYSDTTVLITGESGVGKEVVARRLYTVQAPAGPFIALNCSAIPDNLIESELFGHEKGAFTGATRRHLGVFEQAQDGVLFLDEIGDMPLLAQAKLLRVLQDHRITRVGGEKSIPVRLRIICATHHNLLNLVKTAEFREDLYYRINVIKLHVPALRERTEDINILANHFLDIHNRTYPDMHKLLSEGATDALQRYPWPGNIRELKHTIERACILSRTPTINSRDLLFDNPLLSSIQQNITLRDFMRNTERDKINSILQKNNWKINLTATELGISRKSLWEKIRKYEIPKQAT